MFVSVTYQLKKTRIYKGVVINAYISSLNACYKVIDELSMLQGI